MRRPERLLWVGLGCGLTLAALELPYLNWRSVASPVETQPLTIRHDAKGNGRFLAPRRGARQHRGLDLAAPLHSPVHAIRSGMVIQVGTHRGLGRFVELEHRRDLRSVYAHLSETRVEVGERVRQGKVVGLVGKTGNARHPWIAPHIHLEVWRNGEPIDPQTLRLQVVDPADDAGRVTTAETAQESSHARGGE